MVFSISKEHFFEHSLKLTNKKNPEKINTPLKLYKYQKNLYAYLIP